MNTYPEDEEGCGEQQVQQEDQSEHVVLLVTRILQKMNDSGYDTVNIATMDNYES